MSKFMNGQDEWDWADLGCCAHTALRKCCYSKATSLTYNLVHFLDREWEMVLRFLEREIRAERIPTSSPEEMIPVLQEAIRDPFRMPVAETGSERREAFADDSLDTTKPHLSKAYALTLSLELFDDSDWHGFVSFWFD